MSDFDFVDAKRHNTNLLIAYAGATGTGKTWSALETALGLAGPNGTVGLLDTEAGRATHYADIFPFKHCDLHPPFTPQRFLSAIRAAQDARFDVLVIDSASDEYEGEGGLQEMHDAAIVRMTKKRSLDDVEGWEYDKYNAPAWSGPKTAHKRVLINPLRQLRMHVIFCLRAEDKIEFVKEKDEKTGSEKTKVRPRGWVPICEKRFMYDMTISAVFSPDAPGVPMMTAEGLALNGKIQAQHLHAFPQGKQITRETGRLLAEWAKGAKGASPSPAKAQTVGKAEKSIGERIDALKGALKGATAVENAEAMWRLASKLRAELLKHPDANLLEDLTLTYESRLVELREVRP